MKQTARKEEAQTIAMGLKRNAYHVLRKSDSQSGSEELVVLKHRNGQDMGNINHSKKAMAKACEALRRRSAIKAD